MKIPIAVLFALMVAVQLAVPFSMIYQHERVVLDGTPFKFKAALVDPYDPFRGKYVTLNFEENSFRMDTLQTWLHKDGHYKKNGYITLTKDEEGFATIKNLSEQPPKDDNHYIKVEFSVTSIGDSIDVFVYYPFSRFYMEENAAPKAETIYNEAVRDTSKSVHALVMVKQGKAVISDVFINDVSFRQLVDDKK